MTSRPVHVQNFVAPFATLEGSPLILGDGSNVEVSTLKVLEPDSAGGRGVWLQTSFYIGTTGERLRGRSSNPWSWSRWARPAMQTGLTGERRGGAADQPVLRSRH